MKTRFLWAVILAASLLSGCSVFKDKKDAPLPGERVSLFAAPDAPDAAPVKKAKDTGASLPDIWRNAFWPQPGGYANHAMQHVSLSGGGATRIWSSDIGSGSGKTLPLTAQPVVADGKIFTLDTSSTVRAFDAGSGASLWQANIRPPTEDDAVLGGGVSFAGGRLFASAGFNEIVALNPNNGHVLWRTPVAGAVRGAPGAMPDRVYAVTVDNQTIALDAQTGAVQWTHQGLTETTGLLGSASPAANHDTVLPAYSSGEIYALQASDGAPEWSDTVAPVSNMGSGSFSDIRGLPVIDRGVVVAVSYGGRIAAMNEKTGERLWDANIGGAQTPWVAGNRVFLLTADSDIVSLDMADGHVAWRTSLPKFEKPDDMKGPLVWYGPVLASNSLLVFSSHGEGRALDPQSGSIMRSFQTGQDVVAAPIVANDILYLLSADGKLTAWK